MEEKPKKCSRKKSDLFTVEEIDRVLQLCMDHNIESIDKHHPYQLREAWAAIAIQFNAANNSTRVAKALAARVQLHRALIKRLHTYVQESIDAAWRDEAPAPAPHNLRLFLTPTVHTFAQHIGFPLGDAVGITYYEQPRPRRSRRRTLSPRRSPVVAAVTSPVVAAATSPVVAAPTSPVLGTLYSDDSSEVIELSSDEDMAPTIPTAAMRPLAATPTEEPPG